MIPSVDISNLHTSRPMAGLTCIVKLPDISGTVKKGKSRAFLGSASCSTGCTHSIRIKSIFNVIELMLVSLDQH